MKRTPFFMAVLVLSVTAMIITSCQKNQVQNIPDAKDKKITEQVTAWLETQKSPTQPNKAGNISLLKDHLDFTKLRYEPLSEELNFMIIPVNNDYKKARSINDNSFINLLLTLDKTGNITSGSLVSYTPANGQAVNDLPENTFYKIHNSKQLDCSGKFRFQSVTGTLLYELGYKEGTVYSYGKPESRDPSMNAIEDSPQATVRCQDWYLVTTYYENGVVVNETWDYLGRTCSGCDDPLHQGHCPDDGGGGGGGNPASCCIPANSQLSSQGSSQTTSASCTPQGTDPSGTPIKTCFTTWEFSQNTMLWYNWKYYVALTASLEYKNGAWVFKSVQAGAVQVTGTTPPCVVFNCNTSFTPTLSPDKRTAYITNQYSIDYTVGCFPISTGHKYGPLVSTMLTWNAPQ